MKKLFTFLILSIFLISTISAFQFSELDNIKSYDEETKTATIENSILWIFPTGKVADVKLNTPTIYKVMMGKDRLVAEMTFDNLEDYEGVFDEMKFYDKNNKNKEVKRAITYKRKIVGNGENENISWKVIDTKEELPKGIITIGIFTDVYAGETIEWIPTFYGKEINEWATWSESLSNMVVGYWGMNDNTGNNVVEEVNGLNNGTVFGGTTWTPNAKHLTAISFNDSGTNGYIEFQRYANIFEGNGNVTNWTISLWTEANTTGNSNSLFNYDQNGTLSSNDIYAYWTGGNLQINMGDGEYTSNVLNLNNGSYHNLIFAKQGKNVRVYQNGIMVYNISHNMTTMSSASYKLRIAFQANIRNWNGTIDEFVLFNKSFTNAEAIDFYDSGAGTFYIPLGDTSPTSSLTSPLNNTNYSTSYVNFSCSATDDYELTNISFFLNGERNHTFHITGGNQSDGFGTAQFGAESPLGIYYNGSDYWIVDDADDFVYHIYNGINQSDGFKTNPFGSAVPRGITYNGSDFWIVDTTDTFVYHIYNGINQSDGFKTSAFNSDSPYGIANNGSDFWIVDTGDVFIYHIYGGVNQSDGIKTSIFGSGSPRGMSYNDSDFYISDTGDDFVYHLNRVGANQSDGFKTNPFGSEEPFAVTFRGFNFYIVDNGDDWVYHLNLSARTNQNLTIARNLGDGIYNWSCEAGDSGGTTAIATNWSLVVDTTAPVITIVNPLNQTYITNYTSNATISIDLNSTITDLHLQNCWIYNGTGNVSVTCGANLTINTGFGAYHFIFYANDTFGNENSTEISAYWKYRIFQNNVSFNTLTTKTSNENFIINITSDGEEIITSNLIYNGTDYISTKKGNLSNFEFNNSVSINHNGNTSFYWHFIYGPYNFNSSLFYQNSTDLVLGVCGGTLTTVALNFTTYDEEDFMVIPNFKFYGTFNYWAGDGSTKNNLSISNQSTSEVDICINTNKTYYVDAIIQYEKNETYVKRSYYMTAENVSNVTQHKQLFSLKAASSTSFIINLLDYAQLSIPNAYLYIQRYYPGIDVFKTVEMALTDSVGSTIAHFEAETEDYRVLAEKDNLLIYTGETKKVFCKGTPCTLTLQTAGGNGTTWTDFGNIEKFTWNLDYSNVTNLWTFNYEDTSGSIGYGRLHVYYESQNASSGGSKVTICNVTSVQIADTLTCDVSAHDGKTIYAAAYLSRSPEVLVYLKSVFKSILKAIFGLEGLFLSMFVLLLLALIGLWNPAVGVILVIVGAIVLNLIGIASFGAVTIWGLIFIGLLIIWEIKR